MSEISTKWYIEKGFFWELQPDSILAALNALGIEYHLETRSKVDIIDKESLPYSKDDCVLVYGSIEFARRLQTISPWLPGATWMNYKNLLCSTYYVHYRKYLLNENYFFLPLANIFAQKDFIFNSVGVDNKIFIRPDSPFKDFTGFVASKDDIETKIFRMSYGSLEDTTMALVAKPQKIKREYRFYLSKNNIIASCRSHLNGEADEDKFVPEEAAKIALEIAKEKWQPAPVFVADIAETDDGFFRLLEVNSFNCSGMYSCDLQSIAATATAIASAEHSEVYSNE